MSYFQGAVTSLLSRYISDFGEELTVSLWSGEMSAQGLVLDAARLRQLLPLNVAHASLRSLRVVVPWTRLLASSTLVQGAGLSLALAPGPNPDARPSDSAASTDIPGPPDAEAQDILRSMKQRLKIDISDVDIELSESVHLHAERLYTGPFSESSNSDSDEDERDNVAPAAAAAADANLSRRIKLVGLTVTINGRTVVYPVSLEVVLSFDGNHLSYCNVLFTDDVNMTLSDVDLQILTELVTSLSDVAVPEARESSPVKSEKVAEKDTSSNDEVNDEEGEDHSLIPMPVTQPWTTAVWSYGRSWLSSAAATAETPLPSPVKRVSLPTEELQVLPSWFRLELPSFRATLSRHVVVVASALSISVAPRELLSLRLTQVVFEWSHSRTALELMARIGNIQSSDLWAGGTPLLLCGDDETDAVAVDWVRRPHERYVNVLLEPIVLSPSPPLIRELSLLAAPFLSPDNATVDEKDDEESLEPLLMGIVVELRSPILKLGDFQMRADRLCYEQDATSIEGLSIVRCTSHEEDLDGSRHESCCLEPLTRLVFEMEESLVITAHGPVQLNVCAPDLRALLVVATELAEGAGEELPDYMKDEGKGNADNDIDIGASIGEGKRVMWQSQVKGTPDDEARKSRPSRETTVSVGRMCLQMQDEDQSPLADLLVDTLVLSVANGTVTGSMRGLVLVDRGVSVTGQLLLSTSASDALSSQAYVQLAQQSFAPDVVFASPMYRKSDAAKLSFSYSSSRPYHDAVPRVSYSLSISRVRVKCDLAAYLRLGKALHLGITGLTAEQEAHVASFSTNQLKWHYMAQRLLRHQERATRERLSLERTHVKLFSSWEELCVSKRARAPSRLIPWTLLCLYLQAQASHASVSIENVSVALPMSLGLSVGSVTLEAAHQTNGFAFDRVESRVAVQQVSVYTGEAGVARGLFFEEEQSGRELIFSVPEATVASQSRLNSQSRIDVHLECLTLALAHVPRLRDLAHELGLDSATGNGEGENDSTNGAAHNRVSKGYQLTLAISSAQVSLGMFAVLMKRVLFEKPASLVWSLSLGAASLTKAEHLLASVESALVERTAGQTIRHIAGSGLAVYCYRDLWAELHQAVQCFLGEYGLATRADPEPVPPSLFEISFRDVGISLPMGRQSALHLTMGRVKGPWNACLLKDVALYFGSIRNRATVVGGFVRASVVSFALCETMTSISLSVGNIVSTIEPKGDIEHVMYLMQHYALPESKNDASSSFATFSLSSLQVDSVSITVDEATIVAEEIKLGGDTVLTVPSILLLLNQQSILSLENLQYAHQHQMISTDECSIMLSFLQLPLLSRIGRQLALAQAKWSSVERLPLAAAAVPLSPPPSRALIAIPEFHIPRLTFNIGNERPIMRLEAKQLGFGSNGLSLGSLIGSVTDTWIPNRPESEFLRVGSVTGQVNQYGTLLKCSQPVVVSASEPLMRCISALTSHGRDMSLYPGALRNDLGYCVVLPDGRKCDAGAEVGLSSATGIFQLLCGGRCWQSASLDLWSVASSKAVPFETSDGDIVDLIFNHSSEHRFVVSGNVLIVNATPLAIQVLHFRTFRTLSFVMSETISMTLNERKVEFSSEKGKEEEDDQSSGGDGKEEGKGGGKTVQCVATSQSRFRFRVAGRRWSEVAICLADENGTRALVSCGPQALVWCSVIVGDRQTTLRLSPLGMLENRLPCSLHWAALDASQYSLAPGEQRPFFGRPEDMVFGLSLESTVAAQNVVGLVDSSQSQVKVQLERGMTVSIVCFTGAFTRTRHVQVSAPAILINDTSFPLQFDGQITVAPCSRIAWHRNVHHVGGSASLAQLVGDSVVMWGDGEVEPLQQVLVSVTRDTVTRSWLVRASPRYLVQNATTRPLALLVHGHDSVGGQSELLLDAQASHSLPRWAQEDVTQLKIRDALSKQVSDSFTLEFGTVQLVQVSPSLAVVARIHLAETQNGEIAAVFPRTIVIAILEANPAPFRVRNLTQWPISVQEQWASEIVSVESNSECKLYPTFWREYLLLQRESLDEAILRLGGGKDGVDSEEKKKGDAALGANLWTGHSIGAFPYWVRHRPFVFRIRLDPGGNWGELIETSRPRFFSLPLYSENGGVSMHLSISNVGQSKVITIGGSPLPLPTGPVSSWSIALSGGFIVEAQGLARLELGSLAIRVARSSLDLRIEGGMKLHNLVPEAAYPRMLCPEGSTSRPLLLLRARWMDASHFTKFSLALCDLNLELDYSSASEMLKGLSLLANAARPRERTADIVVRGGEDADITLARTKTLPSEFSLDEIDVAPFVVVLSWKNPKILIPVLVSDDMLSIHRLRLQMPGLAHSGCGLARADLGELMTKYLKDAFLGQTVRILGSLDVLGNPTGIIVAFGSSIRHLQQTWQAAVQGNGEAVLEGATDAVRTFGGALLTPIVSLSNASARMIGDQGALGAVFDLNRQTINFVYSFFGE